MKVCVLCEYVYVCFYCTYVHKCDCVVYLYLWAPHALLHVPMYVRTCLLYNDRVHPVGSYVRMYMCMYVGITEPIPQGDDVRDYLGRAVNPVLIQGLTYLCKEKPEEPIVSMCVCGGGGGGEAGGM